MALEEQPDGTFARSTPTIETDPASSIISFGEDESGELYALTFSGLLAIGTTDPGDATISASGDVRVDIEQDEIVVSEGTEELFRSPVDSLTRLLINLSGDDDTATISDLSRVLELPINIDGGGGGDTLRVAGEGHRLNLTAPIGARFTEFEAIDVGGDGPNELAVDLAAIVSLSTSSDTVRVIHDEDDRITYGAGWTVQTPRLQDGVLTHRLNQDAAIVEISNTRLFQNPLTSQDANRDNDVTARDAIQIINALSGQRGPLFLPDVLADPHVYLDVSGDVVLSALDALQVINEMARRTDSEGESIAVTTSFLNARIDASIEEIAKDPRRSRPSSLF